MPAANKGRQRRKWKSLCEKSMELIVSIIKVSSLSLAGKMSFRTRRPCCRMPPAKRNHHLPPSQMLAKPERMAIEIERKSPGHEIENVDDRASDYIKGFHAKNRHDSRIVSKQLSHILPPPPRSSTV